MLKIRVPLLAAICLGLGALAFSTGSVWRPWATPLEEPRVTWRPGAVDVANSTQPAAEAKRPGVPTRVGSQRSMPQSSGDAPTPALQQPQTKQPAKQPEQLLEALKLRVAALEQAVRRQEQVLQGLQANALPIDPEDVDDATIAAVEEAEQRLADEASLQAHDRVWAQEMQFELEDVDPQWSGAAVFEVNEAIAEAAIDGAHVIGLECRSSICRVEVDYTEHHAQAQVEMAFARLSLNAVRGTLPNDEREPETTIHTYYLTRSDVSSD